MSGVESKTEKSDIVKEKHEEIPSVNFGKILKLPKKVKQQIR